MQKKENEIDQSEIKGKLTVKQINETKNSFFVRINKTDTLKSKYIKIKRRKIPMTPSEISKSYAY